MDKEDNPKHDLQPRSHLDQGEVFSAAVIRWKNNQPEAAAELCRNILAVIPHHAQAMHLLGLSLNKLGDSAQALELIRQALELKPDLPQFMNSVGLVLNSLDRYPEALEYYNRVLDSLPRDAVDEKFRLLINMGNALKDMGCHEEALRHYDMAGQLGLDYAELDWNRSHVLLAQGRFSEGWEGYERRFELSNARQRFYPFSLAAPGWDGTSFRGMRLFVHDEQGLGDTIQFARFIPMVKDLGGEIIFEVRKPLLELFKSLKGVDSLVVRESKPASLDYDLSAPVMSLGKLLNITLETLPVGIPYLKVDKNAISKWEDSVSGPGFKAGLVWACNQENVPSRNRSIRLDKLLPLLEIPGISFHGFQKDDKSGQLGRLQGKYSFPNHGSTLR